MSNACSMPGVQRSAYFPSGSSFFTTWRPLGGFFWPREGLLWALEGILRCLGGVLGPSCEAYWLLGSPEDENVDCSLLLEGFGTSGSMAAPPATERAGAVEELRAGHTSLPYTVSAEDCWI